MDSSTKIRPARPEDAPLITHVARTAFWDTFSPYNLASDMNLYMDQAFTEAKQKLEIATPKVHTFVVEADKVVTGFFQLIESQPEPCVTDAGKSIELSRFYFLKEIHGKGIAHVAMTSCLEKAKQLGFETLWLGVWEENHRARKFYEKWDFKIVGSHVFQLGNDPQNDLILQRSIIVT